MEKILVMCRSMTQAQRSQRLLERQGIAASLIKAPVALTRSGCGYALVLRRHIGEALQLLKNAGMIQGKLFAWEDGAWREMTDDLP